MTYSQSVFNTRDPRKAFKKVYHLESLNDKMQTNAVMRKLYRLVGMKDQIFKIAQWPKGFFIKPAVARTVPTEWLGAVLFSKLAAI